MRQLPKSQDGSKLVTGAQALRMFAIMGLITLVGVLTLGLVMWEWLRVHGWQLQTMHRKESWVNLWQGFKKDWIQLIVIAVIPLGLLSYMVFLKTNFGDPIAFSTVQSAWGRENIGPVAVVAQDVEVSVINVDKILTTGLVIVRSKWSTHAWGRCVVCSSLGI